MQPNNNPFSHKNLRSKYDEVALKWWFSAVDLCAIILDLPYAKARKHWKKFKASFDAGKKQLAPIWDQLKLPATDGKYYHTDVLDIRQAAYLIQVIPSPKAEPYRLWLANLIAANTSMEQLLIQAGEHYATQINEDYKNNPHKLFERLTITKEEIV